MNEELVTYLRTGNRQLLSALREITTIAQDCKELPTLTLEELARLYSLLRLHGREAAYSGMLWGTYHTDFSGVSDTERLDATSRLNGLANGCTSYATILANFIQDIAALSYPSSLPVINDHIYEVSLKGHVAIFGACLAVKDQPFAYLMPCFWRVMANYAHLLNRENLEMLAERFFIFLDGSSRAYFLGGLLPWQLCEFAAKIREKYEAQYRGLKKEVHQLICNALVSAVIHQRSYLGLDTSGVYWMITTSAEVSGRTGDVVRAALGILSDLHGDSLVNILEKIYGAFMAEKLTAVALSRWRKEIVDAINTWGKRTANLDALQGACKAVRAARMGRYLEREVTARIG